MLHGILTYNFRSYADKQYNFYNKKYALEGSNGTFFVKKYF